MIVRKPPEHERNPGARLWFLAKWLIDTSNGYFPGVDAPLELDVIVMGADLFRTATAYFMPQATSEHWVLLKCSQRDQGFFIGLDLSTGAAEVFPRRFDIESQQIAFDFIRTFA